jgi:hypothetical protein
MITSRKPFGSPAGIGMRVKKRAYLADLLELSQ